MNNTNSKDLVGAICDQLWAFHNDRLADPSITKMDDYVQPILEAVVSALPEEKSMLHVSHAKCEATDFCFNFHKDIGFNQALTEVKQTLQAGGRG